MPYTFAQQINPLFHDLSKFYGGDGWFITPSIQMNDQQAKTKKSKWDRPTQEQAKRHHKNARRFLNLLQKRSDSHKLFRLARKLPTVKCFDLLESTKPELVAFVGAGVTHFHLALWTSNPEFNERLITSCWKTIANKHLKDSYKGDISIEPINPDYSVVGRYIADHHIIKPLRVWGNQNNPLIADINRLIEAELTYQGRHEAYTLKAVNPKYRQ